MEISYLKYLYQNDPKENIKFSVNAREISHLYRNHVLALNK